jgi:hypothetical protein
MGLGRVGFAVHSDRIPDFREQFIERNPLIWRGFQDFWASDERFQSGGHIGVARRLVAGQRPSIAAQKRQMLYDGL